MLSDRDVLALTASALSSLSTMQWLTLRFDCISSKDWPVVNPWSDLHGGFGFALKHCAPHLWEAFFGSQEGPADVRLYVLRPCPSMFGHLRSGQRFSFELTLIGDACAFASEAVATIKHLGHQGITSERQSFSVTQVARLGQSGQVYPVQRPIDLLNISTFSPRYTRDFGLPSCFDLSIHWVQPLKLKTGHAIHKGGVSLVDLVIRIIRRANLLAVQQGQGVIFDDVQEAAFQQSALHASEGLDQTQSFVIERTSRRQMQRIPMQAIAGSQTFSRVPACVVDLLELGKIIHVGSNTTFGFGGYVIDAEINSIIEEVK